MVYLMFIILIVGFGFGILQGGLAILFAIIEPLIYWIGVFLMCLWDIFINCLPKWLRIIIVITIIVLIGIFIKKRF